MSQMASQSPSLARTAIPITRFSYNTSPLNTRTFTWAHVKDRTDLGLVLQEVQTIDNIGRQRAGVFMRIMAGTEVMEEQELGELVALHQQHNSSHGGERPVEVVIRDPCIAARYPKNESTVQRIQMKFRTTEEFSTALAIFTDLGLPITERGFDRTSAATNDSKAIVHQPSNRSTSATPVVDSSRKASEPWTSSPTVNLNRALSANPVLRPHRSSMGSSVLVDSSPVVSYTPRTASHHFDRSNSPLKYEIKLPTRPGSTVSEDSRQDYLIATSSDIASASSPIFSNPSLATKASTTTSPQSIPSIYLSQMQRQSEDHSQLSHHNFMIRDRGNDASQFGSFSVAPHIQSSQGDVPKTVSETSHLISNQPNFFSSEKAPMALGSAFEDPFSDSPAPQLASAIFKSGHIQDDWIPPKRELPFKRPRSSGDILASTEGGLPSFSKATIVPRSTSVGRKTPIQEIAILGPTAAPEITTTPKFSPKKRAVQRKASTIQPTSPVSQIDKIATVDNELVMNHVPRTEDEVSTLTPKNSIPLARSSSALPAVVSKAAPPKKRNITPRPSLVNKRPKMVDQSTQTQLSPTSHNQSARIVTSNIEVNNATEGIPLLMPPPESYLNIVDEFVTKYKDRPAPGKSSELWETPGYDEMGEEQRLDMINDYLCRNLENPQFLKLCEDVEHSWRRIGLM